MKKYAVKFFLVRFTLDIKIKICKGEQMLIACLLFDAYCFTESDFANPEARGRKRTAAKAGLDGQGPSAQQMQRNPSPVAVEVVVNQPVMGRTMANGEETWSRTCRGISKAKSFTVGNNVPFNVQMTDQFKNWSELNQILRKVCINKFYIFSKKTYSILLKL